MKKEYLEWFKGEWQELWKDWDRDPTKSELNDRVFEAIGETPKPPFAQESEGKIRGLVEEAFHELQVRDSMHTDIHRKERDANINLHMRRYVDGSF